MPVEGSEDQRSSWLSSPASAALTPGGSEEDGTTGGSVPRGSQGSEATALFPVNHAPDEGPSGEQKHIWHL